MNRVRKEQMNRIDLYGMRLVYFVECDRGANKRRHAHLKRLHAHQSSQLFENDQLQCGGGGKSRPNGQEATPECQGSFFSGNLDHTVDGIVVDFGVRRLVHESGTDHIKGSDRTSHKESGNDGRTELRHERLFGQARDGNNVTLGLIVDSHFGTVQHHGTSDIGVNTTVESHNTGVGVQLGSSLDHGRHFLAGRCHETGLQHIKGV